MKQTIATPTLAEPNFELWTSLVCMVAFALHVFDESRTGFLGVYNPTVTAMRERWGWFPMPTFGFREWLIGLMRGLHFALP